MLAVLLPGSIGSTRANLVDVETSLDSTFTAATGWTSECWRQTTVLDFESGDPGDPSFVNIIEGDDDGDVILASTRFEFAFQGGTNTFWKYDLEANTWSTAASTPGITALGASLAFSRPAIPQVGYYIYAFQGGTTAFWRYDVQANTWAVMASAPAVVGDGGSLSIGYDGTTWAVYATRGGGTTDFWRYDIASNTWTTVSTTPSVAQPGQSIGAGGDSIYFDSDIYVTCGGGTTGFLQYDIVTNTWSSLTSTDFPISSGGSTILGTLQGVSHIYATQGTGLVKFMRYSITGNSWATMDDLPANLGSGSGLAYCFTDNLIYWLQGGSRSFFRYDVPADSWSYGLASTPETVAGGGALCYDGSGYIYGFRGGGTSTFWRYDTVDDSWSSMANAPGNVNAGGALVYAGVHIYAFQGGTSVFWRYDPAADSWTSMANAPATVGGGGALTYDGSQYIYALRGGGANAFWRYDTSDNSWNTTLTVVPRNVGEGGALAHHSGKVYALVGGGQRFFYVYDVTAGSWNMLRLFVTQVRTGGALVVSGDYLYAFAGGNRGNFARYPLTGTSTRWATRSAALAPVGAGGALCAGAGTSIYAFRGNTSTSFWHYSTFSNKWLTILEPTPAAIAGGGAISSCVPSFDLEGSLASAVFDTTYTTSNSWNALFWDSTLPAGTSLAFEVRASDTLFLQDDATPAWVAVGTSSPIQSGLPSGRYLQWRVTLSTDNITVTPELYEVRVYYYGS